MVVILIRRHVSGAKVAFHENFVHVFIIIIMNSVVCVFSGVDDVVFIMVVLVVVVVVFVVCGSVAHLGYGF